MRLSLKLFESKLAKTFLFLCVPCYNKTIKKVVSFLSSGKRQLQQRSRQKGTATQERWLFPFSCKRKVTAKKDGEKTPREANPHWAP